MESGLLRVWISSEAVLTVSEGLHGFIHQDPDCAGFYGSLSEVPEYVCAQVSCFTGKHPHTPRLHLNSITGRDPVPNEDTVSAAGDQSFSTVQRRHLQMLSQPHSRYLYWGPDPHPLDEELWIPNSL